MSKDIEIAYYTSCHIKRISPDITSGSTGMIKFANISLVE